MMTRAVHLEAVSDSTAKGFISAFRRFVSRRGHCQDLFSDNGTNFVGADAMLRNMFDSAKSTLHNEIAQLLTLESTTWHSIPPSAPNFGGLWEAGVRCAKGHLKRVIGDVAFFVIPTYCPVKYFLDLLIYISSHCTELYAMFDGQILLSNHNIFLHQKTY